MKQFRKFITRFFTKRKSRASHFSEALVEGIKDTFKEMGYKIDTKNKKENFEKD